MTSSDLTSDQWRTLQQAPFWVLSAVTGQDRGFSALDREVFADALARARRATPAPWVRAVLESCEQDAEQLAAIYERDDRSVGSGLDAVARVLQAVDPADAAAFRAALIAGFGVAVATARGPYGRAATVEDLQRLRLAAVLMTSLEPAGRAAVVA